MTLGCVEICGSIGLGESELLEKWSRDAKILDIFEGTQQIQLLIIARQLLDKTSAELSNQKPLASGWSAVAGCVGADRFESRGPGEQPVVVA